jgi:hypothetical protein
MLMSETLESPMGIKKKMQDINGLGLPIIPICLSQAGLGQSLSQFSLFLALFISVLFRPMLWRAIRGINF